MSKIGDELDLLWSTCFVHSFFLTFEDMIVKNFTRAIGGLAHTQDVRQNNGGLLDQVLVAGGGRRFLVSPGERPGRGQSHRNSCGDKVQNMEINRAKASPPVGQSALRALF